MDNKRQGLILPEFREELGLHFSNSALKSREGRLPGLDLSVLIIAEHEDPIFSDYEGLWDIDPDRLLTLDQQVLVEIVARDDHIRVARVHLELYFFLHHDRPFFELLHI